MTSASPQGTAYYCVASGDSVGGTAANRSVTQNPEGTELASFYALCISQKMTYLTRAGNMSDSCCSAEVAETRFPIKGPLFAIFQQVPQCPPLSSPVSPNVLH